MRRMWYGWLPAIPVLFRAELVCPLTAIPTLFPTLVNNIQWLEIMHSERSES